MMTLILTIGLGSFVLSFAILKLLLLLLPKLKLYDVPNNRSNHQTHTLKGGGIALVDTLIILLPLIAHFITGQMAWVLPITIAIVVLGGISLIDDIKPLSAKLRLLIHLLVAGITLPIIKQDQHLFWQGLPLIIDHALAVILLVWAMNLTNFMDGINGISATESISICASLVLLTLLWQLPSDIAFYASAVMGAMAAFYLFNKSPAKLFLGDVGSIPLGYILGILLIKLALLGYPLIALILPSYYLMDSSYTLLKRAINGEPVMQAHSKHFYQQAVRNHGLSHETVCLYIIWINIGLFFAAMLSLYLGMLFALIVALLSNILGLYYMAHHRMPWQQNT